MASAMYASGADVIYQAAGSVGTGLFTEAKNLNETRKEEDKVWVVGVDYGPRIFRWVYIKRWKNQTLSLFQQLKKLETQLKILPIEQKKEIYGENLKYDLSNGGVTLARDNASDEAWKAVEAAKADIVSGKIEVPAK